MTEQEASDLNWLKNNARSFTDGIEQRITSVVQLFKEQQDDFISKLMNQEGHQAPNTGKCNESCISYLSCLLHTETKDLIQESRPQSCTKVKPQKHKISDIVPYEKFQIDDSSTKKIAATNKHTLYRVSTPNGYMLLKVLDSNTPPSKDIENLLKELTVADELEHHVFRKAYARTKFRNRHAILLQWIDGHSLGSNDTKTFTVLDFFAIAKTKPSLAK